MGVSLATSVFLSWSGVVARDFSERFSIWLQLTASPVDVFYSPDMPKGSRWSNEIMERLATSDFGILVVTRENLHSEWMHFEAGALSQAIARTGTSSAVTPLLLGVEPYELPTTLAQFQVTRCERADLVRLIEAVRAVGHEPRWSRDLIERQVDAHWSTFSDAYEKALESLQRQQQGSGQVDEEQVTDAELLLEIRREVGNLRQLNEYLVRRLSALDDLSTRPRRHAVRGGTPDSTLDDDLGPIATYQFTSQADLAAFEQWVLENYPSIETERASDDVTVALLAYDEVEQYDRLRIRNAALSDFGGDRLD